MNQLLESFFLTKREFWGIQCEAGKKYSQVVKKAFHLTMAALDPGVRGKPSFVSLVVERGGTEYLLCNLKHDSIPQVNLDLFFDVGERVVFSVKGEGTVHLSGYLILRPSLSKANSKAVGNASGATLNDIDLDDTTDDDDVDFEEIFGNDLDDDSDEDSGEEADEDSEDEDEDDEEEEEVKEVKQKTPKKRQLEEEDSDEDDSSEDEVVEIVPATKKSKKQKLSNVSTPVPDKKNKKEDEAKGKKNPFIDDLNSSIGRTPMPKKSFTETPGKKQDGQNEAADVSLTTESKKKKKKKRKSKVEMDGSGSPKLNDGAPTPKKTNLPGGVQFEDLRVGHGLEAKKGKLVHMYYTGKLDSGKVFDSTQPGSKPFSFKLGSGEVIKGLDLATQGMKVGGKRKIRIPPHMGYKNQRMGDIPPSSTLNFVVELKAVQ